MKFFVVLLSLLLFVSSNINAQDTIIKINGDTIIAKIFEVTPTEIKYKKFNLPDEPTYVEKKSEVKGINYSNGSKEVFSVIETKNDSINILSAKNTESVKQGKKIEPYRNGYKFDGRKIGEREMHEIIVSTNDKEIYGLIHSAEKAKKTQNIALGSIPLFIIAGGSFFIYEISRSNMTINGPPPSNNFIFLIVSGVTLCGGITCNIASSIYKHKRTLSNKKAVQLYNEKY